MSDSGSSDVISRDNDHKDEVELINEDDLPDSKTCQILVEQFTSITCTDEALAQFYLQDHKWKLEESLEAYYKSSKQDDSDLAVLFDSNDGPITSSSSTSTKPIIDLSMSTTCVPPSKFKIITWNVDGLDDRNLKARCNGIMKIINDERPDIIFMQEVIPVFYEQLKESLPQYKVIAGGNEGYFTATLIRVTTVYYDEHSIQSFPNTEMERNLLVVDCHIGALQLRLMNTHLESTRDFSAERVVQLKKCFSIMKNSGDRFTTIFGGDLNLRDHEVEIPTGVSDLWVACGGRREVQYTWDCVRNSNVQMAFCKARLRFDRVYLQQRREHKTRAQPVHFGLVGIERIKGTQCFPSDHWGIAVHFNISHEGASTSRAALVDAPFMNPSNRFSPYKIKNKTSSKKKVRGGNQLQLQTRKTLEGTENFIPL